jgi:hypothetical protein
VWYWYLGLFALLGIGLLLWGLIDAMSRVGATMERAQRIHASIQVGMNTDQVRNTLSGRYLCSHPLLRRESQASERNKEPLLEEMRARGVSGPVRIHIFGPAPFFRVSFTVTFDSQGTVCEKSTMKGWD